MNKKTAKKIAKRYEAELEVKLEMETDRVRQYWLQAELEDIEDGHWNGPRTDQPPESWQGWSPPAKTKPATDN